MEELYKAGQLMIKETLKQMNKMLKDSGKRQPEAASDVPWYRALYEDIVH